MWYVVNLFTCRLSSAGLIYAHYGIEVISAILSKHSFAATSDCLEHLYTNIYEGFVEELDAIDNGVPMYPEGRPRYRISTHLSARVHRLNPEWNATENTNSDQLFQKAMDMVGKEFTERVLEVNKVKLLENCCINSNDFCLGSIYLVASKRGCQKGNIRQ